MIDILILAIYAVAAFALIVFVVRALSFDAARISADVDRLADATTPMPGDLI